MPFYSFKKNVFFDCIANWLNCILRYIKMKVDIETLLIYGLIYKNGDASSESSLGKNSFLNELKSCNSFLVDFLFYDSNKKKFCPKIRNAKINLIEK